MSFNNDLSDGHYAEDRVLKKIKDKYPRARKVHGYFKPYDIYIPEKNAKIEVKYDKREKDTGHIFIEKSYNDKPSGIETTKANYWVTCIEDEQIWIETDALKSLINDLEDKIKTIAFDVKGKKMTGYLVPTMLLYSTPYVDVYNL